MNINLLAARYIEDFVSTKTIAKAKRIYNNCEIILQKIDEDIFYFLCQSESDEDLNYEVEIDFTEVEEPSPLCGCAQHDYEEFCKHVAACLFLLQKSENIDYPPLHKEERKDIVATNETEKKPFNENSNTSYPQKYNSNNLNEWSIFYGLSSTKKFKIKSLSADDNVSILFESQQKSLAANVLDGSKTFLVETKKTAENITAQCSCGKIHTPCEHTLALFCNILKNKKNNYYFDTLIDTTSQKNILLSKYGLTSTDPEVEMFEFYFANTDLKIKPKSNNIIELANWNTGGFIKRIIQETCQRRY